MCLQDANRLSLQQQDQLWTVSVERDLVIQKLVQRDQAAAIAVLLSNKEELNQVNKERDSYQKLAERAVVECKKIKV